MRLLAAWLRARPYWTVSILGLLLLLAGDGSLPLIDRDEPRFAEASREMIARGDFIVPHFNGDYRFDKPPLIYWCQTAAYAALGENAFAARLPSAMFATGAALLLLAWGRRLGRPEAALHAAVMFLTCLEILVWGRQAVADMPMVFFFTLAVWAGWEMTRSSPRPGWEWLFYGSLGLGFLAKGPEAWLPLAGVAVAQRAKPTEFRFDWRRAVAGFAASVAVVALWGVPALLSTHGAFLKVGIGEHVIGRSLNVMQGHGLGGLGGYLTTLPLYFLTFFASFFPWSIWTPSAMRRWRADPSPDPLGMFLLTQAAVVFVVFTLMRTKLIHYTMPAFPCLALWLALQTAKAPTTSRRLAIGATVMGILSLALASGFSWAGHQMAAANLWRLSTPYAQPEMRVASIEFNEPSLIWEFRRVVTNRIDFIDTNQASAFLLGPPPRCLILPTKDWKELGLTNPPDAVVVKAVGIDTATFIQWDLTAVIRPKP